MTAKKQPQKQVPRMRATKKNRASGKAKVLFHEQASAQEFMFEYHDNASPMGFENIALSGPKSGQDIWLDYCTPFLDASKGDRVLLDEPYGSVGVLIKGSSDFRVVVDAHADEISWAVNTIAKNGLLGVCRNGGTDALIAPDQRVNLWGTKGPVTGFFGSPALHVRNGGADDKAAKVNDLFIDIGALDDKEVMKRGILVGTPATYQTGLIKLSDTQYTGRALDDRMCGFINAQALRKLKEQNIVLPYDLIIVNTVQEENGLHGAQNFAARLNADVAIALDVTHDTQTKGYDKSKQGDLAIGKGPVITYGATTHTKVTDLLTATAKKNKIDIQRSAQGGYSSGTNTDSYAYIGGGTPSALISLPLKYMHTSNETVHKKDVEGCINLLTESLKSITGQKSQFDLHASKRIGLAAKGLI